MRYSGRCASTASSHLLYCVPGSHLPFEIPLIAAVILVVAAAQAKCSSAQRSTQPASTCLLPHLPLVQALPPLICTSKVCFPPLSLLPLNVPLSLEIGGLLARSCGGLLLLPQVILQHVDLQAQAKDKIKSCSILSCALQGQGTMLFTACMAALCWGG